MRQLLTLLFAIILSTATYAQDNTLKFLGIPVDGSKSEIISALEQKGFKKLVIDNEQVLVGDFIGRKSTIIVHAHRNSVDRISVSYWYCVDAAQIKIDFNNLLTQFNNIDKYVSLSENSPIPDIENIRYEMTVNDKRYYASWYLKPEFTDDERAKYADLIEELEKKTEAELTQDEISRASSALEFILSKLTGQVWFTIQQYNSGYSIMIYYDNLKNRPNGEDL